MPSTFFESAVDFDGDGRRDVVDTFRVDNGGAVALRIGFLAAPATGFGQSTAAQDPADAVEFSCHSGDRKDDAGLFSIGLLAPFRRPAAKPGYLTFSAGIGALGRTPPGVIVAIFNEICELVRPLHGYGGSGLVRSPNPATSRGRKHETCPRAGCGRTASPVVRMLG